MKESLSYEEVLKRPPVPISAPKPIDLTTLTLQDLEDVFRGFGKITIDEFRAVLKETIGASRDYADGCWGPFVSCPIGYCASRQPIIQGTKLTQLALQKAQARR
jgi:hypothetical protein